MSEREYLTCERFEAILDAVDTGYGQGYADNQALSGVVNGIETRLWVLPDGRFLHDESDADGCRHWIEAP